MRHRAPTTLPLSLIVTAAIGGFALIATLLAGVQAAAADRDDPITVPDEALRACMNKALDQEPTDPVTEAQAATIIELACMNQGVSDLTGMEHLTALEAAILDSNDISDIGPLAALTSLQILGLDDNEISDVTDLAGLTSLTYLRIGSNDIQDVTPLVNLTALETLVLAFNPISDIGALGGMTSLERLYLEHNEVVDLAPLAGLVALEELALNGNHITDVSALSGLTSLKWLYLDDNEITDTSALAALAVVLLDLKVDNQVVDLGDLEPGVPVPNPVVGFDGQPVPLDHLYDPASNSFTPIAGGPTALTWATDDVGLNGDPLFSGTLTFGLPMADGGGDTSGAWPPLGATEDDDATGDDDQDPTLDDDTEVATDSDTTITDEGDDVGDASVASGEVASDAGGEVASRASATLPVTGRQMTARLAAAGAGAFLAGVALLLACGSPRVRPSTPGR